MEYTTTTIDCSGWLARLPPSSAGEPSDAPPGYDPKKMASRRTPYRPEARAVADPARLRGPRAPGSRGLGASHRSEADANRRERLVGGKRRSLRPRGRARGRGAGRAELNHSAGATACHEAAGETQGPEPQGSEPQGSEPQPR